MNRKTDQAISILETLVGFDTTSRDSNLPLIDWVAAYLDGLGIPNVKVMDPTGKKANILGTIGSGDGGIVLSGHTDVVPVDGQDWHTDPFSLTLKDQKLYGRGSSDMKGFIACALAAAPDLAKGDLNRPIHFAFSYDEEVGCLGVGGIVDQLGLEKVQPAICIIGEPTMMKVVNAQKGCTTFRFNPEAFQGVLVKEKDLKNTVYKFELADGSTVELKGDEEIEYDGEVHTAANLFDALKEGYYGKF